MSYNYYDKNYNKVGYSSTDIWGNSCFRGNDGKVKSYRSTDIWGNECNRNSSGQVTSYKSKDIFGNDCWRGSDGKVKGYKSTDIFGNDCFRGADGKIKGRGRGNEAESRPADMIDRGRRFTEQTPEFPGGAPTAFRSIPVERREHDLVPIHGVPSLPSPPRG